MKTQQTTKRKQEEHFRQGYRDGMNMSRSQLIRLYDAIWEASYTGDDLLDFYEDKPTPAYLNGIEQSYHERA